MREIFGQLKRKERRDGKKMIERGMSRSDSNKNPERVWWGKTDFTLDLEIRGLLRNIRQWERISTGRKDDAENSYRCNAVNCHDKTET